ncbi:hypothetical protein M4951_01475 [Blastopirellula sp. J2-11]|uniref:hypothetical protein n=1 Tax=Blastopirellula sp. J2-11 TaxID=2943192 RepID=UPI0021C9E45C|nr:hypothetical protein [Blastopirellula sp. J2-11]UUO06996.1 hypothetical protein M4951_01475 [Blastopirellula sp. J2-11]
MNLSHMNINRRFAGIVMSLLVVIGCNRDSSWQARTYPVTGTITINDISPQDAVLMLYPTGEKLDMRDSKSWGLVKEDGSYELSTYGLGDGAPASSYVVTLTWPQGTRLYPVDRLDGKFANPDNPVTEIQIKPGRNTLPPITLSNVKILPTPLNNEFFTPGLPSN